MPPELKDYDFESNNPDELTPLSLSREYNDVWTAIKAGMVPGEFRMLPYEEQAELTAYFYVTNRIEAYHADKQTQAADKRRREMEAKAKPQGNARK